MLCYKPKKETAFLKSDFPISVFFSIQAIDALKMFLIYKYINLWLFSKK